MSKPTRQKKTRAVARPAQPAAPAYSVEAQEVRALLRRVPDGLKAALNALAARDEESRERVMAELARGLGKDFLPMVRSAALGPHEELARSAIRTLPVFRTRAAGDVLAEVFEKQPESDRAGLAREGALALQAWGINVALPEGEPHSEEPRLVLRETSVSAPDSVGSRSVAARLQDQYGVWHAILILWNDQAGIKDGFMRPMSRHEWEERIQRMDTRGLTHTLCPPDYARWQVEHAAALNARTGLDVGNHLKDWEKWVGPAPEGYEPPDPTVAVRAASEEELLEWRNSSAELFRLPDVQRWILEAADCVRWAQGWSDLQTRIRIRGTSDALQKDLTDLVSQATRDLITDELKALYRDRLADLARVYEWRHQELPARRAAATVAAQDDGEDVSGLNFYLALVQRSLSGTWEILRRGEDPEKYRYRPLKRYQA